MKMPFGPVGLSPGCVCHVRRYALFLRNRAGTLPCRIKKSTLIFRMAFPSCENNTGQSRTLASSYQQSMRALLIRLRGVRYWWIWTTHESPSYIFTITTKNFYDRGRYEMLSTFRERRPEQKNSCTFPPEIVCIQQVILLLHRK